MTIITSTGHFNGFYEWGPGWTKDDACVKWHKFWDDLKDACFWRHFVDDKGYDRTDYLVGTGGSIYLHPLDFTLVYHKFGHCYSYVDGKQVERYAEIDELKEICEKCAEYCGGSFHMDDIVIHEL